MERLTVKRLAKLSGVSVRTLHYYDEIGLLKPARIGENRYRYYGRAELLRLQQIMFYREFDIPLAQIRTLLERPDVDHAQLLLEHRERLAAKAERYRQLIRTIDRTIAGLQGETAMTHDDLYKGFSSEKQAAYERWLVDRFGDDMKDCIADSKAQVAGLPPERFQARMAELAGLEQSLANGLRRGLLPDSEELEPLLQRHRDWVAAMWGRSCAADAYAGLAELYLSHPDFVVRYETIEPGFAGYLATAMKSHAARQTER